LQAGPFPLLHFGKSNNSSAEEPQSDDSANGNPFHFIFGKILDVKSLIPAMINPATGLSWQKEGVGRLSRLLADSPNFVPSFPPALAP
jgi:hypothetical protein